MTTFGTTEAWEMNGRRLSPLLDGICSVVVASTDDAVSASTALGVARAQGLRRRVAVADLLGEAPAIEALLTGDDPHGIADSFLYGVSLNKIARPMAGTDNVFLMPSGTEEVAHGSVYANERWRRLAAGFHQVGALLIVVANPATPGFAALCGYVGALMPVGSTAFPTPPGVPLVAPPAPAPAQKATPLFVMPAESEYAREMEENDRPNRRRLVLAIVGVIVGVIVAIAVAAGVFWPQIVARLPASVAALVRSQPPITDTAAVVVPPTPTDSSVGAGSVGADSVRADSVRADRARADSVRRERVRLDSIAAVMSLRDSLARVKPPLRVLNPGDSVSASRYAVYFATANTRAAAMPDVRVQALDAVALSPVADGNELWFRVTVGASTSRAQAESLLVKLRAQRVVGQGSVVSVPFAILLERSVAPSSVPARLAELRKRGIMAYALLQFSGFAQVYTGAFESPTQAIPLADSLRAMRVTPLLVYRTGRAF